MSKEKLNERHLPPGARQKMPLSHSLLWSTRGISNAINVVLIMNIAYYCTDIVGLNAGVIGALFAASKVIDAFTDLGFGVLLDRTHTRFGKARPYEIFIVVEWFVTIMLFNVPNTSRVIQYAWVFIMYVLINAVCATALGGIDAVYQARVFTTSQNQIKAMSINGFTVMFCSIVFNILFPQFLNGAGKTQAGWTMLVIPMGIFLGVFGFLRFIFCKEIVGDESEVQTNKIEEADRLSLKDSLGLLSQNQPMYIIVAMMFLTFIINNLNTASTYYFKYIYGDIGAQGTAAITSMVVVPALVVFPMLSKKFGTTKILQACSVVGIAGVAIRTIGGPNMATIILGGLLLGIGTLPIALMINTYLIDCMDYGEWKTGTRIEGLVASIGNFSSKLGNGVAVGVIGLVMSFTGYNGLEAVQPDTVKAGIVFLYNYVPLICFGVMVILSIFYKVDKTRPQMEEDLKKKHEAFK